MKRLLLATAAAVALISHAHAADRNIANAIAVAAIYDANCETVSATIKRAARLMALDSDVDMITEQMMKAETQRQQFPRLWCAMFKPIIAKLESDLQ